MNHDILRNSMDQTVMHTFSVLHTEYKNISKAKVETYKIIAESLQKFGVSSELKHVISLLMEKHKTASTEEEKQNIYAQLKILNDAIAVIDCVMKGC